MIIIELFQFLILFKRTAIDSLKFQKYENEDLVKCIINLKSLRVVLSLAPVAKINPQKLCSQSPYSEK